MPCFAPLRGYRSLQRSESGKRPLVFSYREGYHDRPVEVPCGQCVGCRQEKARQWAVRIMHETMLHAHNVFITLTYAPEHLPKHGSLRKRDFQLFMKRLRKRIAPTKVRFFSSGEYGSNTFRPHYHAIIFGYGFPDKLRVGQRGEHPIYRSATLEELWDKGHSEIGTVTYQSASYVARYCVKKLNEVEAHERYRRLDEETGELVPVEAEFATMSRRPGIGAAFYEKYGAQIHRLDSVVVNGKEMKPPKFYDDLGEVQRPEVVRLAKARRNWMVNEEDQSPQRLTTRENVALERQRHFKGDSL